MTEDKKLCGIIMPLATMSEDYTDDHWSEVREVIIEAANEAGFEARMVSSNQKKYTSTIMGTIVHNLYDDPIVVCDLSNNNPNVLFELGMRLAFDQPTVVIIDDKTSFNFDTGGIEHLIYPRDLRPRKLKKFTGELVELIRNTSAQKEDNPEFSMFLGHYKKERIVKLETKEVGEIAHVAAQVEELKEAIFADQKRRRIKLKAFDRSVPIPIAEEFDSPEEHIFSIVGFNFSLIRLNHFHKLNFDPSMTIMPSHENILHAKFSEEGWRYISSAHSDDDFHIMFDPQGLSLDVVIKKVTKIIKELFFI